ncbi:aldo/keto reductase [Aeromicrobium sp.]|uniref:aldo/keto reductase n=1 Tax=Aeromicrobium sp. TaxID=1871063 RepID=UPI0019CD1B12|nr:aldo/keto reductase [Aeromicrobium sp.]MBC7630598.1 aldo/keto reductase [Aeromicrobium sp.]
MTTAPVLTLNDGHLMPALGFGSYSIKDPDLFTEAIASGYRLLDTAKSYGNEAEVGRGVAQSSIPRDDVFITTKLPGTDHGTDAPQQSLEGSLERLGVDHVDLYLIHWPLPRIDKYVETWQALIKLRDQGLTRSIGVSNFLPEHLDRIIAETGVAPAVNQVELHPYLTQTAQRSAHEKHAIITQSWTPLGRGTGLLEEPVLLQIADKHGVTPGQVVLRWHTQIGAAPIPKSATPERFRSNLNSFAFTLDDDDLAAIATLDNGHRIGGDPAVYEE